MHPLPTTPCFVALGLAITLASACGPMDEYADAPGCVGKCDGLASSFKDLFSDMRKVDLGDLVNVGANLATDQINDNLSGIPYLDIELSPTELYATTDQASQDLTLHDLEQLSSGLTARYGQTSFVARITALRVDYLRQHPKEVFAEAQFQIEGKLAPNFGFNAAGLPGTVGFLGAKSIRTTVITPYSGELSAVLQGPVAAIKSMRGFVLPRDVKDIEDMVPGETVAYASDGVVGLNVGLGLPIYITTIESVATLHAVISAAARATLSGKLDIQIIRDEGDTVLVDVGLTGQTNRFMQLAAKTAWGIEGLAQYTLQVGPLKLDVTQMAEKALEDLLNRKLQLASAGYINEKETVRHTVARFAFDLSQKDQALEQALVQATRGDIRLAQALANRTQTGVTQLLDLTRDARSLSSYLGLNFLSMQFYRKNKELTGKVVVTTGKDSQQILFDELDQEGGLFFTSRGYMRRSLVSLMSKAGRLVDADYNLRVQLRETDRYTERDQIQDHVDPLLGLFLGAKPLKEELFPITDAMERYVDKRCPTPSSSNNNDTDAARQEEEAYRLCLQTLSSDATIQGYRTQAKQVYASIVSQGIQGGLSSTFDSANTFVDKLFDLKLTVQSSYQYPALWTGPRARMMVDYRVTDKGLNALLVPGTGPDSFASTLTDVLYMLHLKRGYSSSKQQSHITDKLDDLKSEIAQARDVVATKADRFRRLVNLGQVNYQSQDLGQTTLGSQAHLLVVEGGGSTLSLATVAERKCDTVREMFDKLVDKADFGVPAHQAVGYALLGSVHPSEMELLVDFDFEKDKYADYPDMRVYGRGDQAKLIDAGQFDLNDLVGN